MFGYDTFNDIRTANNHQSGSDYRILSAGAILTGNGAGENDIFPIFLGDGTTTIQWNPILQESEGSSFRTHSGFVNDTWRVSDRLTANVGLRFDKNHGADQSGQRRRQGQRVEPAARRHLGSDRHRRVERDRQRGEVRRGDLQSGGRFVGGGRQPADPAVHLSRRRASTDRARRRRCRPPQAIRAVFDWFFDNGGPGLPLNGAPTIPGVTPQIADGLSSPSAWEYASGVSRSSARRASLRADLLVRHYVDFYMRQADTTTGRVQDPTGRSFDLALITNAPDGLLSRDYAGGNVHRHLPLRDERSTSARNYTLSRASGQLRRRERRQRTGAVRLSLPGIQAGVVELPRRRSRRRSAPSRAALGQLQPGLRCRA